jgi:HEPN/Toprim N-terminal domain 1
MGSIISLGVGRLEIDWGKNQFFRNHSRLFLKDDIKPETYYYADNYQKIQPAYSRPLRSVKRRLELLGYSLARCRRIYDEGVEETPDYYPDPEISFDMLPVGALAGGMHHIRVRDRKPSLAGTTHRGTWRPRRGINSSATMR